MTVISAFIAIITAIFYSSPFKNICLNYCNVLKLLRTWLSKKKKKIFKIKKSIKAIVFSYNEKSSTHVNSLNRYKSLLYCFTR